MLIHVRGWTIILALICTVMFWLAERLGLRFDAALRAVRAWFVAPHRPAQAYQLNHHMADLSGAEPAAETPAPKGLKD